jgi:hypothetical protein
VFWIKLRVKKKKKEKKRCYKHKERDDWIWGLQQTKGINKGCLPLQDQFPKALLIGEIMAMSEPVCGRRNSA